MPPRSRRPYGASSNRRMPKTARPVVWEGCGAQSPHPDPIASAAHPDSPPCAPRDHCVRPPGRES